MAGQGFKLYVNTFIKFIYSEKATIDLPYVLMVKSTVEISQNFVAFSEYMNFSCVFKIQFHKNLVKSYIINVSKNLVRFVPLQVLKLTFKGVISYLLP